MILYHIEKMSVKSGFFSGIEVRHLQELDAFNNKIPIEICHPEEV
jgi:hypothetical protein